MGRSVDVGDDDGTIDVVELDRSVGILDGTALSTKLGAPLAITVGVLVSPMAVGSKLGNSLSALLGILEGSNDGGVLPDGGLDGFKDGPGLRDGTKLLFGTSVGAGVDAKIRFPKVTSSSPGVLTIAEL